MLTVIQGKSLKKHCTGCMACNDACSKDAISIRLQKDGHYYSVIDTEKCVDCGRCAKICPVNKLSTPRSITNLVHCAWNNDKANSKDSASGGTFFALAAHFISEGGYVCGAVIDGLVVKHIVTNRLEDVYGMQGSKYQQGLCTGIYRKVKNLLVKGEMVLFSGTPCQVAAMKSYVGEKNSTNLTTVDFICGGFPSILPLKAFCEGCGLSVNRLVSFRDKEDGWKAKGYRYNFKVEDEDGRIHAFGIDNIVSRAFISHITNRSSCIDCKFSVLKNSHADFSIGDFWGCEKHKDQEPDGISLIIVHNQSKTGLLDQANIYHERIEAKDFLPFNPRAALGKNYGYSFSIFRLIYPYLFQHSSYSFLCGVFGVKVEKNFFGRLFSFYLRVHKKLDIWIKRYILKHFISSK